MLSVCQFHPGLASKKERPPEWGVAGNIMNTQLRVSDKGQFSKLSARKQSHRNYRVKRTTSYDTLQRAKFQGSKCKSDS
jgi:hypothetical protein